jgi:hypothetical protein
VHSASSVYPVKYFVEISEANLYASGEFNWGGENFLQDRAKGMPGRFEFILKWTKLNLIIGKSLKFLYNFFSRDYDRRKFSLYIENRNFMWVFFFIQWVSVMDTQGMNGIWIFLIVQKNINCLDTMNLIYARRDKAVEIARDSTWD